MKDRFALGAAIIVGLVIGGMWLQGRRPVQAPVTVAPPPRTITAADSNGGGEAWSLPPSARLATRSAHPGIHGAASPEPGGIAALEQFRAWTERYLAAPDAAARRALQAEGVALAAARRLAFKELIRHDPEGALALAVPADLRARLPAEVTGLLETRVGGVGSLEVRHLDWQEGDRLRGETRRTAEFGGQRYVAYTYGRRDTPVPLPQAFLHGVALDGELALSESPLRVLEAAETTSAAGVAVEIGGQRVLYPAGTDLKLVEQRLFLLEAAGQPLDATSWSALADPAWSGPEVANATSRSLGTKRVLVVRVDFPDLPGEPQNYGGQACTVAYLQGVNDNEIAPFYAASSFGRTALEFTIAPNVYRVAQATSVYTTNAQSTGSDQLRNDLYAALGGEYDPNAFDHVVMVFSGLSGYPGGMAGGHDIWISGSYRYSVVAHELGHNYGWGHANLWIGSTSPIDYTNGSSIEYGDPFDVMGYGYHPESFGFAVPTMASWGWLGEGQTATATTTATYRIYASDQPGLSPSGTQLLGVKVRQDDTHDYWISFRSPTDEGYDAYGPGAHIVRIGASQWQTSLIPLNNLQGKPSQQLFRRDLVLPVGGAFTDPAAGVSVQVLAHGGTGREQYIDVTVSFAPAAVAPDVGLQPAYQTTVRLGAGALFSTWARAGVPQVSYRWQRQAQGEGPWLDLVDDASYSGTATMELLVRATTAAMDQDLYRCRLENTAGSATTDPARLGLVEVVAGSYTFAGRLASPGSRDGPASLAQFEFPMGLAFSGDTLFVADARNNRMRRVAADGTVSTLGMEVTGPRGVCVDAAGNLYVTDEWAAVIRRYSAAGVSSVFAGQLWTPGSEDGPPGVARFRRPAGIAIDHAGHLYVTDVEDHTVRKVAPDGTVTTLAGTAGVSGHRDDVGMAARFHFVSGQASGIAVGPDGSIYVTDPGNHCVRKIGAGNVVTTFAGVPGLAGSQDGKPPLGRLDFPTGIAVDENGFVYLTDAFAYNIRVVSPDGQLYTVAGAVGITDGVGAAFGLSSPQALVIGPDSKLYLADGGNNAIRVYLPTPPPLVREPVDAPRMASGDRAFFAVDTTGAFPLPQFRWQARDPASGAWTDLGEGGAFLGTRSGHLFVTAARVRDGAQFRCVISNDQGTATSRVASLTLAADGSFTLAGGGAAALRESYANDAGLNLPASFVLGGDGTLTFVDNSVVGVLAPTGLVSRLPVTPYANASSLVGDGAGGFYFTDQYANAVRKIDAAGTVTLVAGSGTYEGAGVVDGPGAAARFHFPTRIARHTDGTLYVYDSYGFTIRAVSPSGQVSTLAGMAGSRGIVDGTGAGARIDIVRAMVVEPDGNLILRDNGGSLLRRVTSSGIVTTFAGSVSNPGGVDGHGTAAGIGGDDGGMALGPDGNIYLAERSTGRIRIITPGGAVSTLRDDSGAPVIFSAPIGIAVDASGLLYVGEADRHTITGYLPPPRIVRAPQSVAAAAGATVQLEVESTGITLQWFRDGVALPGETGTMLTIAGLSESTVGAYTVEVGNRGGYRVSAPAQVVIGTAVTGFAAWQAQVFTAGELSDPAVSGPLADPDLDQIVNLLEYAFALDPKQGEADGLPAVGSVDVAGEGHLTITFRRSRSAPDLTFVLQGSNDLGTWTTVTPGNATVVDHGTCETVTWVDPEALTDAAPRFLRIKVEATAP